VKNSIPAPGLQGKEDDKPLAVGEVVLVQCDGFRCLAFRDHDGTWRDYYRKEELRGPVQLIARFG
jgi:hypothetical protein